VAEWNEIFFLFKGEIWRRNNFNIRPGVIQHASQTPRSNSDINICKSVSSSESDISVGSPYILIMKQNLELKILEM
jgi:hypothetical protein